ncbi:hypothetical protein BOW53_11200 [Solemya pervernicosa gill symbiont]|uniref:Thiamine pyrimidine synthase n=1 Tax=Solemya pervernicosa gill symbiont TaxID=642797 RepID=A0A1T2L3M0_9GAMM|nr:hypothetical protein BOW53_11200 [Solemya pervernicosa gill symbiont]
MLFLLFILFLQAVTQVDVLAADKVTLELKWYHQFQFAGYYAAQEKGFFAQESLEVEINERNPSTSPEWVVWLVSGSILLLLVAFGLVLVVRQLRALVEKRADELKQAHNKLQRYIDILDRYIITSSTDLNGRFTYASEAFSQISKYSTQELLTQPHNR